MRFFLISRITKVSVTLISRSLRNLVSTRAPETPSSTPELEELQISFPTVSRSRTSRSKQGSCLWKIQKTFYLATSFMIIQDARRPASRPVASEIVSKDQSIRQILTMRLSMGISEEIEDANSPRKKRRS